MASTLWANVILNWRDAVLAKVKDSMSFKSYMDLRNSKISTGKELFLTKVLDKAIKKPSKVLHNKAIRKAVTSDKPSTHGKKLHFSTTPRQQQCPQQHPKKSTSSSSGVVFPCVCFCVVVLQGFFFLPLWDGEEILKVSHLPRSHRWEVC